MTYDKRIPRCNLCGKETPSGSSNLLLHLRHHHPQVRTFVNHTTTLTKRAKHKKDKNKKNYSITTKQEHGQLVQQPMVKMEADLKRELDVEVKIEPRDDVADAINSDSSSQPC